MVGGGGEGERRERRVIEGERKKEWKRKEWRERGRKEGEREGCGMPIPLQCVAMPPYAM